LLLDVIAPAVSPSSGLVKARQLKATLRDCGIRPL
jgi:hypothetical protein